MYFSYSCKYLGLQILGPLKQDTMIIPDFTLLLTELKFIWTVVLVDFRWTLYFKLLLTWHSLISRKDKIFFSYVNSIGCSTLFSLSSRPGKSTAGGYISRSSSMYRKYADCFFVFFINKDFCKFQPTVTVLAMNAESFLNGNGWFPFYHQFNSAKWVWPYLFIIFPVQRRGNKRDV